MLLKSCLLEGFWGARLKPHWLQNRAIIRAQRASEQSEVSARSDERRQRVAAATRSSDEQQHATTTHRHFFYFDALPVHLSDRFQRGSNIERFFALIFALILGLILGAILIKKIVDFSICFFIIFHASTLMSLWTFMGQFLKPSMSRNDVFSGEK